MSIQLKAVQKTQPGVKGGGKKGYIAMVTNTRLIREREFMELVSQNYHVSTVDLIRVLNSVAEEVNRQLSYGNSVELYNLGIFSLSVRSAIKDSLAELKKSPVSKTNINFRPATWFKKKLSVYKFSLKKDSE